MAKNILILDDPRVGQPVRDGIMKDFEQYGVYAQLAGSDPVAQIAAGEYDMLVVEPFELNPPYARNVFDAAKTRGIPIFVLSTQSSSTLDGHYGLHRGEDYAYYAKKPASSEEIRKEIALALSL